MGMCLEVMNEDCDVYMGLKNVCHGRRCSGILYICMYFGDCVLELPQGVATAEESPLALVCIIPPGAARSSHSPIFLFYRGTSFCTYYIYLPGLCCPCHLNLSHSFCL